MTTPPPVHPAAVDAAAAAIFKRHDERGDSHVDEMGHQSADVLAYLRRRYPDFAPGLRVDDLDDVAVLLLGQWWDDQRRMLFWLRQVVALKANRKDFAAVFGIGPQGFKDWLDRLEALLGETGTGRPDEQAMRADRRSVRAAAGTQTAEQRWLDQNRGEYAEVARQMLAFYMVVDDPTAEAINEVRRDLEDGAYDGGDPIAVLGLAMEALVEAEVVVGRRQREEGMTVAGVRRDMDAVVQRWARLQQLRKQAAEA